MKRLSFTMLLAVLVAIGGRVHAQQITESTMRIEGTSSVHDFTCSVKSLTGSIAVNEDVGGVESATIVVPVSQIDCDNGTMNKKVREALNASSHPGISFTLGSATPGGTNGAWQSILLSGELEMNGKKRPIQMTVEGQRNGNGTIVYRGSAPIDMTDHDVRPPTAMLGALKTSAEVQVHFEVTVKG